MQPLKTVVLTIINCGVDDDVVQKAAALLRAGEVVAFPTETVYGLGANALDEGAITKIFEAKGRPANNPLIVHVLDICAARKLAASWPDIATLLADAFWPGPLTLVLPRTSSVPDVVTGGNQTVGLRVPAHPVARAILTAAGLPIAAPSANRSNAISPTRAAHVLADLDGLIPLIIDGGATNNVESTVVDVSTPSPRILRPGPITAAMLQAVLGAVRLSDVQAPALEAGECPSAPGQLPVHYAPVTPTVILPAHDADALTIRLRDKGRLVARLTSSNVRADDQWTVVLQPSAKAWQAGVYDALHTLDDSGADVIVIDAPPNSPEWAAVNDRLSRACARAVEL